MTSNAPRAAISGFALAETLVALLLLAFAMLGAGRALVESLAGQRAALLRIRAADLAGNLAEALRSAPDAATAAAEIRAWQAATSQQLPRVEPVALLRAPASPAVPGTVLPAGVDIHLQWREGASRPPAQLLLPLGLRPPAAGP
jgi:type II secretory pathway pseudopilin PulG